MGFIHHPQVSLYAVAQIRANRFERQEVYSAAKRRRHLPFQGDECQRAVALVEVYEQVNCHPPRACAA